MSATFPDIDKLTEGLTAIFYGKEPTNCQVRVLDREPAVYTSTAPSEIVTCRLDTGTRLRLFCKYGGEPTYVQNIRHRGGVPYESKVYRLVLQPSKMSQARFYGAFEDDTSGKTWLVLEYLDQAIRLSSAPEKLVLFAAKWLGQFHSANETRLTKNLAPFLISYDADYYLKWSQQTLQFVNDLCISVPWFEEFRKNCKKIDETLLQLLPPTTIVHGEFYPMNILVRGKIIYPVDWESAANAVGEIDLAALTMGWSEETVKRCERAYQRSRWRDDPPVNFQKRLEAARLYQQLWLANNLDLTNTKNLLRWLEQLRCTGARLGLLK